MAARGEAATVRQQELGSYSATGLWLEGRPVYEKTEGETRYLRMEEGKSGWQVGPTLVGTGAWLTSGRGTLSPGDPAAGASVRNGWEGWQYADGGEWQESRGLVTVTCG